MYKKLKRILKISLVLLVLIVATGLYINYKNIDLSSFTWISGVKKVTKNLKPGKYDAYKLLDIKNINQNDGYPTGCESVSAVMILKYYGFDVSVEEFIKGNLETSFLEYKNGQAYGDGPWEKYIGDPTKTSGFGCYAPVMERALNKYLPDNYTVSNITGYEVERIITKYIDNDIPVMMWVTLTMRNPGNGKNWIIKSTNEKFVWPAGEHCMVLVGYDNDHYYFNDPYNNNGLVMYEKEKVEEVYKVMGSQAIAIIKN